MQFRFILMGCIALGAGALLFVSRNSAFRPIPVSTRAPAAPVNTPPEFSSPTGDLCQNFYKTICSKHKEVRDPTGTVDPDINGEVQALRLYQEIGDSHPDWGSRQINEELVNEIYTPKRRTRVESAFQWTKYTLQKLIDRQSTDVFTKKEKKRLKQRIQKMELELPTPDAMYDDEPELYTTTDVYYQRTAQDALRVRVGGAYFLTARSWFNMVFTFGHELAHAIDPCEIRSARQSYPAYDHLTSCFLSQNLVLSRKMRSECGENDQLSETFADWFGVAVLAEALKTYATEFRGQEMVNSVTNAVRDLCENDDDPDSEPDTEFHPSPRVRIEKILGLNPQIREVLGCGPPQDAPQYCGFMSSIP